MSAARECWGEKPAVYEASGKSPGKALTVLGKHPHLRDGDQWNHGVVALSFTPDGYWVATAFVS